MVLATFSKGLQGKYKLRLELNGVKAEKERTIVWLREGYIPTA